MEKYLEKLSELIVGEIGKSGKTCVCFADLCGISRNEMSAIINHKKKDLRLSTIISICENSGIKIEDIFCDGSDSKSAKNLLDGAYIVIDGEKYNIKLEKLNRGDFWRK